MPPKKAKKSASRSNGVASTSSAGRPTSKRRATADLKAADYALPLESTGSTMGADQGGDEMVAELQDGSDDDMDWEEVDVEAAMPTHPMPVEVDMLPSVGSSTHIEVTLTRQKRSEIDIRKKVTSNADRMHRMEAHKLHTLALIASTRIRNRWLNDPLLQARLLSVTPLHLQNAFAVITKRNQPDVIRRGRMFETAITRLTAWWNSMFEVEEELGIRSRTWHEVQTTISAITSDRKGKSRASSTLRDDEPLRSVKSLMKHLLMMKGSRDVSAQLFTALVRALGVPARLIASLQSVPWQSLKKPSASTPTKGKERAGLGGTVDNSWDTEDGGSHSSAHLRGKSWDSEEGRASESDASVSAKKNGKSVIRLSLKQRQSNASSDVHPPTPEFAALSEMPVFWTEVFSRPDQRWFPVDVVRDLVNTKRKFEPETTDRRNRMVYVVAFEEDGFARDVTARYTRQYGARVMKARPPTRPGSDWWEDVMTLLTRPYRLHRDDLEDAELQANQFSEGMPNSVAGFKNHPLYALERHLRREETIHPRSQVGTFRGEPVFPRNSVVALKTAENWMRQGRKVKEAEFPLKSVKQRAVTLEKRRAQEMAEMEGEEVTQGLYAQWQTELFRPDPIIDGRVPKNGFGNIDLYVPSMLPQGGVQLPYKGIARVAKKLGFDYAEAVVGFEFRKRRAVPILEGIVVAAENEEALLEAYWETAQVAEEQEREKKRDRAIKRWVRLIQGLRIRQRLHNQYSRDQVPHTASDALMEGEEDQKQEAGGFFTSITDVLQPYQLPKAISYFKPSHNGIEHATADQEDREITGQAAVPVAIAAPRVLQEAADPVFEDENSLEQSVLGKSNTLKTVAELAAEEMGSASSAARKARRQGASLDTLSDPRLRSKPSRRNGTAATVPRAGKRRRGAESETSSNEEETNDLSGRPSRDRSNNQAPTPASGRTLRPRKHKTADMIQAEKDIEAAIRTAAQESADEGS